MSKYLVLYLSSMSAQEQMASATPEQGQESMEEWTRWAAGAGPAIVDLGEPVAHAFSVPEGTRQGLHVGGYSIMQADSAEELRRILEGHPHHKAPGATIEAHEILELPGM
jgi:hypothetical protein